MIPDFNNTTRDTIAKRSGFICSNPDCRVNTVGPNSDSKKSTTIGEAAHIYGARSTSKRFLKEMTDAARAEVTNGIWLCRNCHKLIDTDEFKYAPIILFKWIEIHEKFVLSELGNKTDQIQHEQLRILLSTFSSYPPIIKRIIIDRPAAWKYRLTAELQRFLNKSGFRKLRDLKNNLYFKPQHHITNEVADEWSDTLDLELSKLSSVVSNLIDFMKKSWEGQDESGDVEKIHHVCLLFRDYIDQIIIFEEKVQFSSVPECYKEVQGLLRNRVGAVILKLESIPESIDKIVGNSVSELSDDWSN